MSSTTTQTHSTPEEFLELPDNERYELVDGQLEEKCTAPLSSYIGGTLLQRMRNHCEAHQAGWVFPADCDFRCFPDDPNRIRKPDVAFVRRERLPDGPPAHGFVEVAPDLVAEVLSPNELAWKVERKVKEYLEAGVKLVWIINPETRSLRVHRADGSISGLEETDELDGEEVLPEFRCPLADLFTVRSS